MKTLYFVTVLLLAAPLCGTECEAPRNYGPNIKQAILDNDIKTLGDFLNQHPNNSNATSQGVSLLNYALHNASVEVIEWLIMRGAAFSPIDGIERNHVVQNLIRGIGHLTPESRKQNQGRTIAIIRLLFAHELVAINAQDGYKRTPLMWAADFDLPVIAQFLLEQGADTSITNAAGRNALELARSDQMRKLIQPYMKMKRKIP